MVGNVISKIRVNMEFMTPIEKKIAKVLLDDPQKFTTYSVVDVVDKASVSLGSVMNFARKYANGSFSHLKLQVAADLGNSLQNFFSNVSSSDTARDALLKNVDAYKALSDLVADVNNEDTLERVAQKILKAKRIEIYAMYRSAMVARDLYYQLVEIGLPTSFVDDILVCSVSAAMLSEDSLVIAISNSGQTKDVIMN